MIEIDKAGNASDFRRSLTIADAKIANMAMTFAWLLVSILEPDLGCGAPRDDEVGAKAELEGSYPDPLTYDGYD